MPPQKPHPRIRTPGQAEGLLKVKLQSLFLAITLGATSCAAAAQDQAAQRVLKDVSNKIGFTDLGNGASTGQDPAAQAQIHSFMNLTQSLELDATI